MNFQAFDIETTGLTAQDTITAMGFADEDGYTVHYNAANGEAEDVVSPDDRPIEAVPHEDEVALLSATSDIVTERELHLETSTMVGFNADHFDFPMMRTRCLANDIGWHLSGVNYLDLMNVFKYDWNTTALDVSGFNKGVLKSFGKALGADIDSGALKAELRETIEEHGYDTEQVVQYAEAEGKDVPTSAKSDLEGIYELLIGGVVNDPFDGDSKKAVQAWSDGNVGQIVGHNACDLRMTWELAELLPEYIPDQSLRTDKL